jgi:Tfp pilus assembly protein PilF
MRTRTFTGSIIIMLLLTVALAALDGCGKGGREEQKSEATPGVEEGGTPAGAADLYGRAAAAYIANNDDEAFNLLGQIPDGTPESAKAHNLRGLIQARRGNMALAAIEFKQATAQDPKLAQAHNNLGVVHLADGKPDEAVAAFQSAIQADPYYAAPHRGLAEAYYKQGKMTEAKNELRVVDEISRSQAAASAPGMQDLQIGQPLDVASLIAQEETATKPKPKPAAKPEPAAKPAPKTVTTQVSAPAGSRITLSINQALSTATNKTGEAIEARVVSTVVADGDTLIRAGAPVKGTIASAKSAGRVKGQSELALAFTEVKTVTGWREMKGHVVEGTLKGGTSRKSDAAKVGIGAAAGAVIGEIVGDKAGTGAAVGAAAGAGLVLATKGKEVELPEGTSMAVELDQPLSITIEKTVPAR